MPLAPFQPLSPLGPPPPLSLDPETLRKLSEAAAAISTHAPPSPEEQASINDYMQQQNATFNASPQHQAAQAMRDAVAGGQPGLNSQQYGGLSPDAKAFITRTFGGMGSSTEVPPPAPHLGQSNISSAIASGSDHLGGMDNTPITGADIGNKAGYYANREAWQNAPLPPQDPSAAYGNITDAGVTPIHGGTGFDGSDLLAKRMSDRGQSNPMAGQQAADMARLAAAAANAPDMKARQAKITQRGEQESIMRHLRMDGPAWLLTQPNQGYNPAAAAMFPELGKAQLAGLEATNDSARAGAAQTTANAAMLEAGNRGKEFDYLQTPAGLMQQLLRAGAPVPPEVSQAAAAQVFQEQQKSTSATSHTLPPAVALASLKNATPEQTFEAMFNQSPSDADLPAWRQALAARGVGPAELMTMRKNYLPHFFDWHRDQGPVEVNKQRLMLINKMLAQSNTPIPPDPASRWNVFNPFYWGPIQDP